MNDGSFKQDTVSVLVCYRGRYEEHVIFHRWDTRDKITKERWDENASRLGHDIMDWTDKQLKEHHEYAKAVKARKGMASSLPTMGRKISSFTTAPSRQRASEP